MRSGSAPVRGDAATTYVDAELARLAKAALVTQVQVGA
jgi:hypothetical protein